MNNSKLKSIKDILDMKQILLSNKIKLESATEEEKTELKESIKTNINSIREVLKECYKNNYIDTATNNKLSKLLYEYEQNMTSDLFNSFELQFNESFDIILNNLKEKYHNQLIDIDELNELKTNLDNSDYKQKLTDLINDIQIVTNENEVVNETTNGDNAEQTAIEDNEGSLSNLENSSNYDNMSIEQVIQSIAYSGEDNFSKVLFDELKGYNIDSIIAEKNRLTEKKNSEGKLSFTETIKLHNLIEKETLYYENELIRNPAQAIRDLKLSFNNEKQNKYAEKIENIKSINTGSFVGKFISNKLLNRYDNKIKKLKSKEVKLIKSQKLSLKASNKLKNNIISIKSGIKTAKYGVTKIPSEVKNTISDFKNLFSNPDRIYDLNRRSITMASYPQTISINTPELINEVSRSI